MSFKYYLNPNVIARWFRVDLILISLLLIILTFGFAAAYSASGESHELIRNHFFRVLVSFVVLFILSNFSVRTLFGWTPYLYALGILLLILVLQYGSVSNGSKRWLSLGGMRFQPSELMKIWLPMMVAWACARFSNPLRSSEVFVAMLMIVIPVALVMLQPDLGTSLLIASSGIVVVFLAGLSWRWIFGGVILLVSAVPLSWFYILHDYQKGRVIALLDPWSDPFGSGYHAIQSMIAVGSGGGTGKGWLSGTQSQLDFIPERSTDFIFSVFAEEFGFLGGFVLLLLYFLLSWRGLVIAFYAQDNYVRLLAAGLSFNFFASVFVNIGMVIGILPVVGATLPLMSYGGTSLLVVMAMFGLLMSIERQSQVVMTRGINS